MFNVGCEKTPLMFLATSNLIINTPALVSLLAPLTVLTPPRSGEDNCQYGAQRGGEAQQEVSTLPLVCIHNFN